jgi:hypothetical protein
MGLGFFGKRTSFKFSPLASRQLDDLKRRSRLPKDSDVLIAAIDVLAYLIEFVNSGGQIFLQAADGRRMWQYTPYAPPVGYPNFAWSKLDDTDGPKQRRSFAFSGVVLDRVRLIKSASRFQSDSDVVRASIAVLHELLCAIAANDRIILRSKRGVDRPYNPLVSCKTKPAVLAAQAEALPRPVYAGRGQRKTKVA